MYLPIFSLYLLLVRANHLARTYNMGNQLKDNKFYHNSDLASEQASRKYLRKVDLVSRLPAPKLSK